MNHRFKRLNRRQKRRFIILTLLNVSFLFILLFGAKATVITGFTIILINQFFLTLYHLTLNPNGAKTIMGEWFHAILFALLAAIFLRSFVVEAFTIPSSSMEKTLLIGDFIFVSKINYGPRIPMTPLALPFTHHSLPYKGWKAYIEWLKIPYYRLPGLWHIRNNDVVVFNYPMEDYRPVDKREHYIKRCVAIPGDEMMIIHGTISINNRRLPLPHHALQMYHAKTDDIAFFDDSIRHVEAYAPQLISNQGDYLVPISMDGLKQINTLKNVTHIERLTDEEVSHYYQTSLFPYDKFHNYQIDNFGPIKIPRRGDTVYLNHSNIALYKRIIEVYENHKLEEKDDKIYIDNVETSRYIFAMDYYFMMGDNRYNSEDSRFWGFVPEDHIVGKASMIWMSWDKEAAGLAKIRWRRLFRFIN